MGIKSTMDNRFKLLYDSSENSFAELKEFLKLQTMHFTTNEALELAQCLVSIDDLKCSLKQLF